MALGTGHARTVAAFEQRIEGAAWTRAHGLMVSSGRSIYVVDPVTGAASARLTVDSPILDFAVDERVGSLYIETTAGKILRAAGAVAVFAEVRGRGKLAISPDRFLVRIIPVPVGSSGYQEWPLGR